MLRPKRITPLRKNLPRIQVTNPLAELASIFVEWTVAVGMSPDTARIRRSGLDRFMFWSATHGIESPGAINSAHLEAYQVHLAIYRKANGEPIAASTRACRLNPVIAFCRWLARRGLVADDPSRQLVLGRAIRRIPSRVPSIEEMRRILDQPDTGTISGVRDRGILELLYSSALRRSEVVRLNLQDVSLESELIFVRSGKGNRDRVVPLGTHAARWVRRYVTEARVLLAGSDSRDVLFLTDFGEAFIKNRLGDLVRRYVVNSGFPGKGACHLFRHACATHMLELGADIRFIQELLGHSQLSTTEIYTRVSIGTLRSVHAATHPRSIEWRNEVS